MRPWPCVNVVFQFCGLKQCLGMGFLTLQILYDFVYMWYDVYKWIKTKVRKGIIVFKFIEARTHKTFWSSHPNMGRKSISDVTFRPFGCSGFFLVCLFVCFLFHLVCACVCFSFSFVLFNLNIHSVYLFLGRSGHIQLNDVVDCGMILGVVGFFCSFLFGFKLKWIYLNFLVCVCVYEIHLIHPHISHVDAMHRGIKFILLIWTACHLCDIYARLILAKGTRKTTVT